MTVVSRRPFWLVHRGHVQCHGLLFSARAACDRLRIFSYYRSGTQIFELEEGELVLLFSHPRLVNSEQSEATVLVRYEQYQSAVPLTSRELEHLQPVGGFLVDAVGGRLRQRRLLDTQLVDPAEWFSLGDWSFENASPLSSVCEPADALEPHAVNHREALEHAIGEPPREAALFEHGVASGPARRGASVRRTMTAVVVQVLRSGFVELIRGAARLLGAFARRRNFDSPEDHRARRVEAPSMLMRLTDWLRRQLWRSRLGQLLGAAEARYLRHMLDLFEQGDLVEALRHAIPTNKLPGSDRSSPPLLPSGPRTHLTLGQARGHGGTLHLSQDLFSHLRATYEAAYQQLVNRGQIAEAAFVLSELLQDDERAVHFLEGHGRHLQAAKLAELRQLSPGLVVRQWFLAGDRDRALAMARRDGAFEDAIIRLKGIGAAQDALRLSWADALADAGNYAGAALVVSEVEAARHIIEGWLERAVEVGGVSGAQALGMSIRLATGDFATARECALAVIEAEFVDSAAARVALARELAKGSTAACRAVLRGVTRALISDSVDSSLLTPHELRSLVRATADGALHADLPEAAESASPPLSEKQRQCIVRESDRGTVTCRDVCALGNGRLLVACGEAGCLLLAASGKPLHHFDVPADRLVTSPNGDRVLAVAHRDDDILVSRVNVSSRTCATWCDLRASAFAARFDGSSWYVALKQRVVALDATAEGVVTLWSSAVADAPIVDVHWSELRMEYLTTQDECWLYHLKPHRLTSRQLANKNTVLGATRRSLSLTPVGDSSSEGIALVDSERGQQLLFGAVECIETRVADAKDDWLVAIVDVTVEVPRSSDVKLIHLGRFESVLHLRLEGASRVCARLDAHALTVGDEHGRVLAFELATLRERANARLTL